MDATPLEQVRLELKRVRSMLEMLKDNTHPDDIRKLEHLWLNPIKARLREFEVANQTSSENIDICTNRSLS